jgi:hypothetical protein
VNQYNEWRAEDAPLYQPSARPAPGTGYGPPVEQIPGPQADPGSPPPPRRRGLRIFAAVGFAVAALLVLIGLLDRSPAPDVVVPTPAPAAAPAPPVVPDRVILPPKADAKPANEFGEGNYDVGNGSGQIAPGRYRTAGPGTVEHYCYWSRLRDTDGQTDSIIANGNTRGAATVTIRSTDAAFEIQGDCVFKRAS